MPSRRADYMRQWRQNNPSARARDAAEHRARSKALYTLASRHPDEFERLLDAERALEGLPPVHTVKRGRPALIDGRADAPTPVEKVLPGTQAAGDVVTHNDGCPTPNNTGSCDDE